MTRISPQLNLREDDEHRPWSERKLAVLAELRVARVMLRPRKRANETPQWKQYRKDVERLIGEGWIVVSRTRNRFSRNYTEIRVAPSLMEIEQATVATPVPYAKRKAAIAEFKQINNG